MSMNHLYAKGRIVKPATISQNSKGSSVHMTVAIPTNKQVFTNGKWVTEETIVNVNLYDQQSDYMLQNGHTGATVIIEGTIKSYFNQKGELKTITNVTSASLLSQKSEYYEQLKAHYIQTKQQQAMGGYTQPQPQPAQPNQPNYGYNPNPNMTQAPANQNGFNAGPFANNGFQPQPSQPAYTYPGM